MKWVWISGWGYGPRAWGNLLETCAPGAPVQILDPLDVLADRRCIEAALGGADDAVLAGWSLGALLALEWALDHPNPQRPLLLVSATASFCRRPGAAFGTDPAQVRALRAALRRDREKALRSFYAWVRNPRPPADDSPPAELWTDATTAELLTGLDYLLETDLRAAAGGLRSPLCLLHGGRDAVISPDAGRDLHDRVAGSAFVLAEEAGHDIPFTHTSQLTSCLNRLLCPRP